MEIPVILDWVLRSSLMASVLVCFILFAKLFLKNRIGARWHYYIWFLHPSERKMYGRTIIKLLEGFIKTVSVPMTAGILSGRVQNKERLNMITRFRKYSFKWTIPALIFFILAGCVSLTDPAKDSLYDLDLKKEAVLKFYFSGTQPPDARRVLDEVENAVKNKLNIKLDFKWVAQDKYFDKMKTLLASADNFDAFEADVNFNSWAQTLSEEHLSLDDLLLDITDLFPRYAAELYREFTDEELAEASYNGKITAIPHHLPGSFRMCAVVRDDLMKKYNISEIDTFADYVTYLEAVGKNEKGIIPGYLSNMITLFATEYGYVEYDYYLLCRWDDPEMKLIPWEQTPEFKDFFNMVQKCGNEGYITDAMHTGNMFDSIANGTMGSFLVWWDKAQLWAQKCSQNYKLNVYPLSKNMTAQKTPITSASILLNKNSPNPERTIAFINWVESGQENYDLFMYGKLDEHYSLNDDRLVYKKDKKPYFGWPGSEAFININYIRSMESDPPDYMESYMDNVTQNTKYPPANGFIPNWQPVAQLADDRWGSCRDMEHGLARGSFKQTADEFIQEQKDAGVDKLVLVIQKQLDEWRVKNYN